MSPSARALDDADVLLAVRVQQFLYDEAHLLDTRQFSAWLELFDADAVYEIRSLGTVGTGAATGKAPEPVPKVLTREQRSFLDVRVARLERGLASCEIPASLTRRLVTNVRVEQDEHGGLVANSNLAIFQARKDEDWIIGQRTDRLVRHDGAFLIQHRCVTLDFQTLPRTVTLLL